MTPRTLRRGTIAAAALLLALLSAPAGVATAAPAPVTGLTAQGQHGWIDVSWSPSNGADGQEVLYVVQLRQGSGVVEEVRTPMLFHSFGPVDPMIDFTVAVAPEGGAASTIPAAGARVPEPPRDFRIDPGAPLAPEWLGASWTPLWDGGRPFTAFRVEGRPVGASDWTDVLVTDGMTGAHPITGLQAGVTYEFRVRAVNNLGASEPTAAVSALFVGGRPAPSSGTGSSAPDKVVAAPPSRPAPGEFTALAADGAVQLRWEPSSEEAADAYAVRWNVGGATEWAAAETSETVYRITGLENGESIEVRVAVVDESGRGEEAALTTAAFALTDHLEGLDRLVAGPLEPGAAYALQADGLPADAVLEASLDGGTIATATADSEGTAELRIVVPDDARPGSRTLHIGIDGPGLETADIEVVVAIGPASVAPSPPGPAGEVTTTVPPIALALVVFTATMTAGGIYVLSATRRGRIVKAP